MFFPLVVNIALLHLVAVWFYFISTSEMVSASNLTDKVIIRCILLFCMFVISIFVVHDFVCLYVNNKIQEKNTWVVRGGGGWQSSVHYFRALYECL